MRCEFDENDIRVRKDTWLLLTGRYYVILDTIAGSVRQHRDLAQRLYMAPSISFVQTNLTSDLYSKNYKTTVRISVSTPALFIQSFLSASGILRCSPLNVNPRSLYMLTFPVVVQSK